MKVSVAACVAGLVAGVAGHGMLTRPVSRALRLSLIERNGSSNMDTASAGLVAAGGCLGHACEWYTQWTIVPPRIGTTNCNASMRTMGVNCDSKAPGETDWPCTENLAVPWCAPGYAPVISPCGIFGGGYGQNARDMMDLDNTPVATWVAGKPANVSWAVTANHGGGYAYRLCRHDSPDQNETCFQKGHLEYYGDVQYIYNNTGEFLTTIPARRMSTGTWPKNSQWTRNPFPQEKDLTPIVPGLPDAFGRGPFEYNTVDTVMVPADLEPGDYTLSFRWDAEQTKQVWQQCSDVRIVAPGSPIPPLRPPPPLSEGNACTGTSMGLDVKDCAAWLDIYDNLGGKNWPSSWAQGCSSLRTDPCGCARTWQKNIVCSFTRDFGHITELYLLGGAPTGTIPDSLTDLTHLQSLSIVNSNVEGKLPMAMGNMQSLSMIWLDHNPKLTGPVPPSIANLPNISVLELHRSGFSGTVLPDGVAYEKIPDCTLNDLKFSCPNGKLPEGAETCGASCQ